MGSYLDQGAVFKRIECVCGHLFMLSFGQVQPVECLCGLGYDPRIGNALPVWEGFDLPVARTPPDSPVNLAITHYLATLEKHQPIGVRFFYLSEVRPLRNRDRWGGGLNATVRLAGCPEPPAA